MASSATDVPRTPQGHTQPTGSAIMSASPSAGGAQPSAGQRPTPPMPKGYIQTRLVLLHGVWVISSLIMTYTMWAGRLPARLLIGIAPQRARPALLFLCAVCEAVVYNPCTLFLLTCPHRVLWCFDVLLVLSGALLFEIVIPWVHTNIMYTVEGYVRGVEAHGVRGFFNPVRIPTTAELFPHATAEDIARAKQAARLMHMYL